MSIPIIEIKSPLSQVSAQQADAFLATVSAALSEPLERVSVEDFTQADFDLIFVASGGSEGIFRQMYLDGRFADKTCYLLSSQESNSLAASLEILTYLRKHGGRGEILHGDPEDIARRIHALAAANYAKAKLRGLRLGLVGAPSDWLIASDWDADAYREKLNAEVVPIPMRELIDETKSKPSIQNEWTEKLLSLGYCREETEKALTVYAALRRIVERYRLGAVTVRCFDLLDTVCTTGCLALAILNAEGVPAGCEGDVPSTMSMAILSAVTKEPVFMCNPSRIDTKAGNMILAHCTLPLNMPYSMTLTTHFESGIGVAIAGSIAEGPCTVFKTSGDLARYYVKAGKIIENLRESTLCRSQIRVAMDDFSYFMKSPIQNHHLVCKGDHTDAINAFYELLEDREK